MKKFLLFVLLSSGTAFGNCIEVYQQGLIDAWEDDSERNGYFTTTYITAMFAPLGLVFGQIAGPVAVSGIVSIGIYDTTHISKRRAKIDNQAKALALISNADSGEGNVLDEFIASIQAVNQDLSKDAIITEINTKNDRMDFCADGLKTYNQILNEF